MTDIPTAPSAPQRAASRAGFSNRFYLAAWRWHFYAGLFVAPFLVILAVTGLIMLYAAAISGRDGENIAVPVAGIERPVAAQEAAVAAAFPEGRILEWIGARRPGTVAMFRVEARGGEIMVAVDPYRAAIVDQWPRRDALYDLANTIHGTLLLGTLGDRLIEIAAGFGIVLLATGVYLAWPRGSHTMRRVTPRETWRRYHRAVGLVVSPLLLAFLVSGHAWTGIWGETFVQAWSTFPAEKWENVPLSDETHAAMNHGGGKHVPWALEQTPLPASGSDAGLSGLPDGTAANLASLVTLGRELGFARRFHVNYPQGESGVWTLSQDSMSNDTADPTSDRTVHVDRYTGRVLADIRFADYSAAGKAMAVGVAFHEGDIGLANLVLNTGVCLSIIFFAISGGVMWWLRRPEAAGRLFAPPMPGDMPLWRGAAVVMLLVSMLFPLVGLTLIVILTFDLLVVERLPKLRQAMS